MKKKETITVLFWISFGVFVMYSSWRFGLGTFRSPGPGLMPFLLGVLLCLVALYFLGSLIIGKTSGLDKEQKANDAQIWKIALVVGSLVSYALILEKLGYIVSTLLLLFIMYWAAGTSKRVAVISSAITVLLTYILFSRLGVVFPQGILKLIGA
ncbi:MAG TPA: tripartite tricarboxylate transporter TctB family protein [Syntrophorhabdaceae bacterium]|nr:tripartite tricarboxylate transporter TctB family protein [Syntrophorhabdaceae bacterium]